MVKIDRNAGNAPIPPDDSKLSKTSKAKSGSAPTSNSYGVGGVLEGSSAAVLASMINIMSVELQIMSYQAQMAVRQAQLTGDAAQATADNTRAAGMAEANATLAQSVGQLISGAMSTAMGAGELGALTFRGADHNALLNQKKQLTEYKTILEGPSNAAQKLGTAKAVTKPKDPGYAKLVKNTRKELASKGNFHDKDPELVKDVLKGTTNGDVHRELLNQVNTKLKEVHEEIKQADKLHQRTLDAYKGMAQGFGKITESIGGIAASQYKVTAADKQAQAVLTKLGQQLAEQNYAAAVQSIEKFQQLMQSKLQALIQSLNYKA